MLCFIALIWTQPLLLLLFSTSIKIFLFFPSTTAPTPTRQNIICLSPSPTNEEIVMSLPPPSIPVGGDDIGHEEDDNNDDDGNDVGIDDVIPSSINIGPKTKIDKPSSIPHEDVGRPQGGHVAPGTPPLCEGARRVGNVNARADGPIVDFLDFNDNDDEDNVPPIPHNPADYTDRNLWGLTVDGLQAYITMIRARNTEELGERFYGRKLLRTVIHQRQLRESQRLSLSLLQVIGNGRYSEKTRVHAQIALAVLPSVLQMISHIKKQQGSQYSAKHFFQKSLSLLETDRYAEDNLPRNTFIYFVLWVFEMDRDRYITPVGVAFDDSLLATHKRLKQLVKESKITKMKEALVRYEEQLAHQANPNAPPPRPFPTTNELRNLTAELFPVAPDGSRSMLDPAAHAQVIADNPLAPFNLTFDEYSQVMRKCPKHSAEGCDAWNFGMFEKVMLYEDLQNECFEAIKVLTELAYDNRLPGRFVMCETRVVFIPKDVEGTRFRPIGIASALYRFIAKLLLYRYNGPTGQRLGGIQLAVGRPDGCSIGAKTLQHLYDQRYYIQASDSPNAFNREDQNRIYLGIQQYCPNLLNFFIWSYGEAADLRSGSGELLGQIETGVRQGDPLSMLFFCVSIHSRLLEMQAMLDRFDAEDGVDPTTDRSLIIAYADDVFPSMKPSGNRTAEDVRRRFIEINTHCADHGVPFNMAKTNIIHHPDLPPFHRNPDDGDYSPFEAKCQTSGVMLGAMISSDVRDIKRKVADTGAEIQRICTMISKPCHPFQACYLILAFCLNAYPTYLARIYNPLLVQNEMEAIDTCIDRTLGMLVQGNPDLPPHAKTIRALPHRLGGLGMTRYASPFSYIHADALSQKTLAYIEQFFPHLHLSYQDSIPIAPPGRLGDGEALLTTTRARYQGTLKLEHGNLISQLSATPSSKALAVSIAANSFRGSGAVFSLGGYLGIYKSEVFQAMVRNRLLIPCQTPNIRWRCGCRYGLHLNSLPYDPTNYTHHLCCPDASGFRTTAHTRVVKALREYLAEVVPQATIVANPVFFPNNAARRKVADLSVTVNREEGAVTWTIDAGIAQATGAKYINEYDPNHPNQPSILSDPHRAAKDYETRKVGEYRDSGAPRLVPFIITHPGNIGPKASLFLDAVEGKDLPPPNEPPDPERMVTLHSARHQLLTSIVHACQSTAAHARRYTVRSFTQQNIPPPIGDADVLNEAGFG